MASLLDYITATGNAAANVITASKTGTSATPAATTPGASGAQSPAATTNTATPAISGGTLGIAAAALAAVIALCYFTFGRGKR